MTCRLLALMSASALLATDAVVEARKQARAKADLMQTGALLIARMVAER